MIFPAHVLASGTAVLVDIHFDIPVLEAVTLQTEAQT